VLGRAALTAWRICAEPELLDPLDENDRQAHLHELGVFLTWLVIHHLPHLAPQPVSGYPQLVARFTDGERMAQCWLAACSLISETGGPDVSRAAVGQFEEHLADLPRDLVRQFDETSDDVASRLLLAVGRSVLEEAEDQSRRYTDLKALVEGIAARPDFGNCARSCCGASTSTSASSSSAGSGISPRCRCPATGRSSTSTTTSRPGRR
jgi:hypothetical protein